MEFALRTGTAGLTGPIVIYLPDEDNQTLGKS